VYEAGDGVAPSVGETARFYGKEDGYVRGLAVGDRPYFYETAEQVEARAVSKFEHEDPERSRELEYDLRTALLPAPLRNRIERFRQTYLDFRTTTEGMEILHSENAARLAQELGTPEATAKFKAMPHEERLASRPWLYDAGHSEESPHFLDAECGLATWYLNHKDD
jgi:hypothetical protein